MSFRYDVSVMMSLLLISIVGLNCFVDELLYNHQ